MAKKEKKKTGRKRKIFGIVFCILLGVILVGYFVKIRPMIHKYEDLTYEKLSDINEDTFAKLENTKVYDKNNKLIGEINSGSYQYTEIGSISKYLQEGYIATEDKNFKHHNGIDYFATIRAGFSYIKNRGNITQGGSTITQQLIKNSFLNQERTFTRKIAEFFLAPQIEKMYTKTQIMEYYCNSCYYGNRCYGVGNASRYYFKKNPSQLSLAEAAMLIGLSNNPSKYDPVANYKASIAKRDRVLKHMLDSNVITKTQYEQAKSESIQIKQYRGKTKSENYQTSFAVYQTTLELMDKDGFEFQYVFKDKEEYNIYKEKYQKEYAKYFQKIRNGGYKITTSFDSDCQKALQKAVDKNLSEFVTKKKGKYKMQGAAVSIDNETGDIVAVVGGRGTDDEYNRSYLAIRQPGSSIKPLLDYAPAFESGVYYPSKVVSDTKTDNGPSNSSNSYAGKTTIRQAVIHSTNTVAWQLLQKVGVSNGLEYLSKMEFNTISYLDDNNASAALGGFTNGMRVVDMAKGFATLENEGVYQDNSCVKTISFKNELLAKHKDKKRTIYSSASAYMITDCMKDAVNEGTGTKAKVSGQVIAGKTGTTNDYKDAWFCGFSKYYTTSVWMGYDNPKPMDSLTGGSYPAEIFHDYMKEVHKGKAKKEFEIPDTVEVKGGELFAKNIDETLKQSVLEKILEEQVKKATKKVKKFEAFEIDTVEDAVKVDKKYNAVISVVDQVDDSSEKTKLRERVETHYLDLTKEKEKWEDAIRTYEEKEEQKRLTENEKAAAEAKSNREAYEKQQNIDLVKSYIERLEAQTEYSNKTETIITEARAALEKCASYSEYNDLKAQLEDAISSARALDKSDTESTTEEEYN